MRGNGFFDSTLPLLLLLGATALLGAGPLHAENTPPIATAKAAASAAGSGGSAQPERAREARDGGHDGAGYFDRGIRVSIRLGDEGHDGSGRFDHPAQPDGGWRREQDGAVNAALR
jgi:hypothetical protein